MNARIKKFRIIKYKPAIKPALKIKNVSKSFNGVPVLQNLNLNILPADEGEIYAKGSTLISSMPIHERCKKFRISYVPQKTSLFLGLSCQDNIKGVAQLMMKDSRKIDEICDRLLTEFSLLDVAKTKANDLSGGQKKKLSIARSLISDQEIILLDEIFAALSPKIIDTIKNLIVNLQTSRKNISILISDHIYQHILDLSDTVHILSDGAILKSLKPADIIKDESARKAYFGFSDSY